MSTAAAAPLDEARFRQTEQEHRTLNQRLHLRYALRNLLAIAAGVVIIVTEPLWWPAVGLPRSSRQAPEFLSDMEAAVRLSADENARAQLRLNAMVELRQHAVGAMHALQVLAADDSARVRARADVLLQQIRKVN